MGGLSDQETSRRGNYFGMAGMVLAVVLTFFMDSFYGEDFAKFFIAFVVGGVIGFIMAIRVNFYTKKYIETAKYI